MFVDIADKLEQSQRDYDTVAQHFTALLSEIAETMQGEPRTQAFKAAHDALRDNGNATSQLDALHAIRDSIRQQ